MLGHEDRMAAKRRLLAIIDWNRRGQTSANEILRMLQHHRDALILQVCQLLSA